MSQAKNQSSDALRPSYAHQCQQLMQVMSTRTRGVEEAFEDRDFVYRKEVDLELNQLLDVLRQIKSVSAMTEVVEMEREAAGLECYVSDMLASPRIDRRDTEPLTMALDRMEKCLQRTEGGDAKDGRVQLWMRIFGHRP